MDVEFALLADAAQSSPDGKLHVLGGGISEIFAPTFPATHPVLAFVLNLRLHPLECNQSHRLHIQLWDADGRSLQPDIAMEFDIPRNPRHRTRDVFAQLVLNIVGLQLPQPGDYDFHVVVDGRHLKTLPLYVQQGQPAARTPPPL